MKELFYGGSRTPLKKLIDAINTFDNAHFMQVYASTEGHVLSIMNPTAVADHKAGKLPESILQSAGTVDSDVKVVVLDDQLVQVPQGKSGIIYVHSENIFPGYLNKFELSKPCLFVDAQGRLWYKTGDEGFFDQHGFLHVHGRTGLDVVTLSNTL